MTQSRPRRGAGCSAALLATLLFTGAAADAGSAPHECAAAKLKSGGRKASGVLGCHRKAAAAGDAIDPACVARTDEKLEKQFARAESRGGCIVDGEEAAVSDLIDQWAVDLAALLRPSQAVNDCAEQKLRTSGEKAFGELRCHAGSLKREEPTDPECLGKVEEKFAERFADAELSTPCLTMGDAAGIDERVERLSDALRAAERSGCLVDTVAAGDSTRTLVSGGQTRTYRLHVPSGYAPGAATPLLLSFHGGTGNATQHASMTEMHPKSDSAGFLLIEPEGFAGPFNLPTWNAGNCCGPAKNYAIDDVAFTEAMIDDLAAEACVDQKRVFSTGHSNGAMFSYRLACELADRIAAIAPNAGGIADVNQNVTPPVQVFDCSPSRSVPVFHMHGDADTCYQMSGGVGTGISGVNFISIPATIDGWVARNGCSTNTVTTFQNGGATCETYQGCAQGADVTLCTLAGHGHAWPSGAAYGLAGMCGGVLSTDLAATDALWDFFVAHPMP
jgi:polyhydroxybutyrate depolymerase